MHCSMDSVPSASAFSLPLPPWQQPRSLRAPRYAHKKRKKDPNDWGDNGDDLGSERSDTSDAIAPSSSLILSPEEAHQYRVAGLSFDKELPRGHFPHGPEDRPKRKTRNDVLHGLSSLSPPIYPPQSVAHQGNLRLQHLGVLTAVLHRCLLQGDYIRAGRAWGLILREEFWGSPVDVRTEGRWGIGAEILLRQGRQLSDISSGIGEDGSPQGPGNVSRPFFTKKGFDDAKEYYERLIIQHPHRKAAPEALCSLHFYPAMFGLWIYVTQEEGSTAREHLHSPQEDSSEEEFSEDEAEFDHAASRRRKQTLIADTRATELEQAQHIAARMDEAVASPPYSDFHELLELRGMVSLWIADLFVLSVPQKENDDYDSTENDSAREDLADSIQERREQRIAFEKRKSEMEKSRKFFEKSRQRSKGVTHTLEHFHIDDTGSPVSLE